ncbi:MAG: hypothetical protein EOP62_22625 [Sphingomonadales bacterium]|nr:MAG: hypothetical protein EOP62_22625 [Sphingomonadales bacterium]
MKNDSPLLVDGKTVEEWDRSWIKVPHGLKHHQRDLRDKVGLYRINLGHRTVAIGTGTDKGGGLAKRLSDFRRKSPSGRNHYAGRLIYEHLDRLEVDVLITGGRYEPETGRQLRTPMIRRHRPDWTVLNAPYMRK